MLIINADDFGKDEQTNAAVNYCFDKGLCSSTTIMATMPRFEQACKLAHDKGFHHHVGLHLVLSTGYPLTGAIRKHPRFCSNNGEFNQTRKRILRLSANEKEVLAEEIRAQILKCRDFGLPITHIDSHHHRHEEWGIASVLISVMKEFKIPHIRIMANVMPARNIIRQIYTIIFNRILKNLKLSRTDYFGSIHTYLHSLRTKVTRYDVRSSEVCIHPTLDDENIVKEATSNDRIDDLIMQIDNFHRAMSFGGHSYSSKGTCQKQEH